jgi:RNA polymerase sigma factor (sigma-70 family)
MEQRDPSVVARAREGDRDAFRALVETHSRYIYSLAHRMTGNAQDAEDVVQEAWLKAHKQLSRFEARADVRTWMHRITVNCSIDLIRARRHREDAHDPIDLEQGPLSDVGAEAQPTPERVLQAAVGDHLDRTQMMLVELANADTDGADILAGEQERAVDLVAANRVIRQSAMQSGDVQIVDILEDLERVLQEIANAPTNVTSNDLTDLQSRITRQDLLFIRHAREDGFALQAPGDAVDLAIHGPRRRRRGNEVP